MRSCCLSDTRDAIRKISRDAGSHALMTFDLMPAWKHGLELEIRMAIFPRFPRGGGDIAQTIFDFLDLDQ